eukprot:COSAG02_NODE_2203_length_9520_cov_14.356013_8_plen_111_part_00
MLYHETIPAGRADSVLRVREIELETRLRQPLEVGSLHEGVAVRLQLRPHVVCHQMQDVRPCRKQGLDGRDWHQDKDHRVLPHRSECGATGARAHAVSATPESRPQIRQKG